MARKRSECSFAERKLIIKLVCQGKSYRKVADYIGRTHSTVQYVVNKYKYEGRISNKEGRGRKRMLTERDEKFIVKKININPKAKISDLTKTVSTMIERPISEETVKRVLRRRGYNGRISRKKPFISKVNRNKRFEFAKKYIFKGPEFWKKVLFSDESKFNIFGSDGRQIAWRKPNTEMNKENLSATVKHGGGNIMIWGCMASNGVGNLKFIDCKMDRFVYLNILRFNLKSSAEKLGIQNDFYFQQDNDPKHTAEIVKEWLSMNIPNQLHTPPQSPDLNPIEHLWDEIGRRLRTESISSKSALKLKITKIWDEIAASVTTKLVESMPRRLQAVIDAKGYSTRY